MAVVTPWQCGSLLTFKLTCISWLIIGIFTFFTLPEGGWGVVSRGTLTCWALNPGGGWCKKNAKLTAFAYHWPCFSSFIVGRYELLPQIASFLRSEPMGWCMWSRGSHSLPHWGGVKDTPLRSTRLHDPLPACVLTLEALWPFDTTGLLTLKLWGELPIYSQLSAWL